MTIFKIYFENKPSWSNLGTTLGNCQEEWGQLLRNSVVIADVLAGIRTETLRCLERYNYSSSVGKIVLRKY
jgi:hypothetical protein